ncbi:unnamed protein product [Ranitomeya imitator]|uniref:Sulfotransferase n=1 Tax=Ranitomeya imitator TaxID=111125 RepID=A0ABN9LEA5_9NEOB|nr:unnamed protein product [Ranitomeya imitator]
MQRCDEDVDVLAGGASGIIYTIRDPKDAAVSLYYFSKMSTYFKDPENMDDFLKGYLTGNIPYGSWFNHVKGWMGLLGKDNFMFQTYEDLKKDRVGFRETRFCQKSGRVKSADYFEKSVADRNTKTMQVNGESKSAAIADSCQLILTDGTRH